MHKVQTLSCDLQNKQIGRIMTDLNEAIDLGRQVLRLCSSGHPNRSMFLNNVAIRLFTRYQSLEDMADLSEAIVLGRQALDIPSPKHPNPSRSMYLNNAATYISDRYKRFGDVTDLDEAFDLAQQALNISPPEHVYHPVCLNSVATCLLERYKRLGELTDLEKAITLGRQALDITPPEHPSRSACLNNIAMSLSYQHKRLGEMKDLNEAIVLGQEALDITQPGHPSRPVYLNSVATCLASRHKLHSNLMDLNKAIVLGREALDISLPCNLHRSVYLSSVAACLFDRHLLLGDPKMVDLDLDNSITLGREALDIHPLGHPKRSQLLGQLASRLCARFTKLNDFKDKEDLFNLYSEFAEVPGIFSLSDVFATEKWVCAAEDFHHPTMLPAYETSFWLLALHLATVSSLPEHLQILKNTTSSLAVDAFSASLRDQHTKKAVELLEQGHGLFWSQISRLRSPLEDVIASGPAGESLADEFTCLKQSILDVINSHSADKDDRLFSLNLDLQVVITNIRRLPGLARFLLPSLFSDLQHAARGGPVIIVNASKYTCDALVVFFDRDPVHIPLKITKSRVQNMALELQSLTSQARKMDVNMDLANFLRNLWDEVVFPIINLLQTVLPAMSRIWWCPTAEFSLLPLHAAGPFRKGELNLPHLYISSYTPTLTALIRARRSDASGKSSMEEKQFLFIGRVDTNRYTESTPAIIAEHVEGFTKFTRLEGPKSSISLASDNLEKSSWVHFDCLGRLDRKEPIKSAFKLCDGPLTFERIIGRELENMQFAYVSAYYMEVADQENLDEVAHLASVMQVAGCSSVVGTMQWAVEDGQANQITSMFYKNLVEARASGGLDHTCAALALNKTMDMLTNISLDQRILYVHVGA